MVSISLYVHFNTEDNADTKQDSHSIEDENENDLVGTRWILVSMDGTEINNRKHPTINFAKNGRISGYGGCNGYYGSYSIDDNVLTLDDVATHLMACSGRLIMETESAYISVL